MPEPQTALVVPLSPLPQVVHGFVPENGPLLEPVQLPAEGPDVAYQAGPDPRPMLGSPTLKVGAAAVPPFDGELDTTAQYVGAFGDSNWLEEWTVFGPESAYEIPVAEGTGSGP